MKNVILLLLLSVLACNQKPKTVIAAWIPYDESEELAKNADHESRNMRYKLIQSKVLIKMKYGKMCQIK